MNEVSEIVWRPRSEQPVGGWRQLLVREGTEIRAIRWNHGWGMHLTVDAWAELPVVDGGVLREDARRRSASQEDRRALAEATEKVRTLTAMVERLQREKDAEVTVRRVTHEDNERLRADVWCVRGEQEAARVRAGVLETELKELRAVRDKLDVERAARAQAEKECDEALVGREKAETERRVAQELREVAQQACRRWQDEAANARDEVTALGRRLATAQAEAKHFQDEGAALRSQLAATRARERQTDECLRAAQSEAEAAKNLAASYLKERDEARAERIQLIRQVDGLRADVTRAKAWGDGKLRGAQEHITWLQGKLAKTEAARADAQSTAAPADGVVVVWVEAAGCGHCGFPTCIEGEGDGPTAD